MRQLGKYRLHELIASGGMADVFRAEMPGADGFVKQVALKLIRGEHGESSDFVRMFIEEARLASRLNHANIVQVFEFDRVEGRYYIAMEYVRGRSLRQIVDRCRELGVRLELVRALHICREIAKALAYAHRVGDGVGGEGIVHRDVSPPNVLVSFEGEVKLADFGIARAMGRAGLTEPGIIKGKAAYMAPEQARGGPVDTRADVFSLAILLWELCCGRRLFARDSEAATLAALTGDFSISSPSSWNEAVPEELDRAIMNALVRDVEQRTRSAEDLANELGMILLKMAKTPADLDLRAFMRRLWPDGTVTRPRASTEPTPVRPDTGGGTPVRMDGDAVTRTAAALAARKRRWGIGIALTGATLLLCFGVAAIRRGPATEMAPITAAAGTDAPAGEMGQSVAASLPLPTDPDPGTSVQSRSPPPPPTLPEKPRRPKVVLASRIGVNTLPLPAPESGEGLLTLNAIPWGTIYVDGQEVGHTPRELRLRAGPHRVRIVHPTRGTWTRTLVVNPGQRTSHIAQLE